MTHWFVKLNTPFPVWLLVAVSLFLGVCIYFYVWRDSNVPFWVKFLRLAVFLFLFVGISQCTFVWKLEPQPGICVILDDSPSMNLPLDFSSEISRFTVANELSRELLKILKQEGVSVQSFRLSEFLRTTESPLAASVQAVNQMDFEWEKNTVRLAGIVLLTDGVSTDAPNWEIAHTFRSDFPEKDVKGTTSIAPLFPLIFGTENPFPQYWAEWLDATPKILCGEKKDFHFRIFGQNLRSPDVQIQLFDASGKTLADFHGTFERAPVNQIQVLDVTIPWKPETEGVQQLRLKCSSVGLNQSHSEGKITANSRKNPSVEETLNPELSIKIDVKKRLHHVLLVTAAPDWEYRYLRNLLAREPSIQLETWAVPASPLAPDPRQDVLQREEFPTREELEEFDAVILNSISPDELGAENASLLNQTLSLENPSGLRALVLLAGHRFQPEMWRRTELNRFFPVSFENWEYIQPKKKNDFRFSLTSTGRNFCSLAGMELPKETVPIYSFWNIPTILPGAQVWAETQAEKGKSKTEKKERFPLLIQGRTGSITTFIHTTDGLWRFRNGNETFYNGYWVQMLHSLLNVTDSRKTKSEESRKDSEKNDVNFEIQSVSLPFVQNPRPEFHQTSADRATMQKWVKHWGGRVLEPEKQEVQSLVQEILLTLQSHSNIQTTEVPEHRLELWSSRLFWAVFCGILTTLWIYNDLK